MIGKMETRLVLVPCERPSFQTANYSDFIFRRLRAAVIDVVPKPFMQEVQPDLRDTVECAGSQRYGEVMAEYVDDRHRGDRPQQAVTDGFGDAPRIRFHLRLRPTQIVSHESR